MEEAERLLMERVRRWRVKTSISCLISGHLRSNRQDRNQPEVSNWTAAIVQFISCSSSTDTTTDSSADSLLDYFVHLLVDKTWRHLMSVFVCRLAAFLCSRPQREQTQSCSRNHRRRAEVSWASAGRKCSWEREFNVWRRSSDVCSVFMCRSSCCPSDLQTSRNTRRRLFLLFLPHRLQHENLNISFPSVERWSDELDSILSPLAAQTRSAVCWESERSLYIWSKSLSDAQRVFSSEASVCLLLVSLTDTLSRQNNVWTSLTFLCRHFLLFPGWYRSQPDADVHISALDIIFFNSFSEFPEFFTSILDHFVIYWLTRVRW